MYDSFWMGASFSFIIRLATFRMLRWPHTSGTLGFKPAPLSLLPQLITGGILFSLLDVARRIGIEEALKREEADEFNKQLRKDEKNYDL